MSDIFFKVFVHGLIALVPGQNPADPNHMTALLIDAQSPPMMECMAPHHPKLDFAVNDASQQACRALGCALTGSKCSCTDALARKQIRFEFDPPPTLSGATVHRAPPPDELPTLPPDGSPGAAGSFAFVPNLASPPFSLVFNDNFRVSPTPSQALLSRMELPFQDVATCNLARRFDKGVANIHSLTFGKLGSEGQASQTSQAVAQMVVGQISLDEATRVTLHIEGFAGDGDVPLLLKFGAHGYEIEYSNETLGLSPDDPCDDGVARHFAGYYALALNPPPDVKDYLIPKARPTKFTNATGADPGICDHYTFTLMSHPICPMASYF